MSHTDAFDALMGDLPGDWSFVECYVALDDPMRLSEARVALARANARSALSRSGPPHFGALTRTRPAK